MGFFSKKETEENATPRNPNNVAMFRVLAVCYVGYLCIQLVKTYLEGGPDAPSLFALICGLVLLGGGDIFLAILSYKEWKRDKVKYDEAMAVMRAEAKAAREAEEAEEARKQAEDEYYETLETAAGEEDTEEDTEEDSKEETEE